MASFAGLARLRGAPALEGLDRLAPCLGALVVLGRLGCFFAGCDFGEVSPAPWAVRFPPGTPAFAEHAARGLVLSGDHRSLPVHPTQLYEALLGALASASALIVASRRGPGGRGGRGAPGGRGASHGRALWTATLVYAAGRLALDGLRGDGGASSWGGWTPSQWISAALLVWGTGTWVLGGAPSSYGAPRAFSVRRAQSRDAGPTHEGGGAETRSGGRL